MTLRIEETEDSRSLAAGYEANQKSIDLEFVCWDTEYADLDPVFVGASVETLVLIPPPPLGLGLYGDPLYGLRYQTVNLKPLTKSIVMATVHYGMFEPPKKDKIRIGLSTGGGSELVTHSLATIGSHSAFSSGSYPSSCRNWGRAINVTKDGAQGTQRELGSLPIRITAQFDPTHWNHAQWLLLKSLKNCWNLYAWHGWPATYLQFQGVEAAEFELGTGTLVPVTFHFLASEPEIVDKGNGILFTKHPWSYVWDFVIDSTDPIDFSRGKKIQCTYEEHLYPGADFALLGIGS